jgi:hypothetical protein
MFGAVMILGIATQPLHLPTSEFTRESPLGWQIRFQVPAGWRLELDPADPDGDGPRVYVAPGNDRLLCVTRLRVLPDTTPQALCHEILVGHAEAIGLDLPAELVPEPVAFGDWPGAVISWSPRWSNGTNDFRIDILGGVAVGGSPNKDAYTLELRCMTPSAANDNSLWRNVLDSIVTATEE